MSLVSQIVDSINIPRNMFNKFIDAKVERKITEMEALDTFNDPDAKTTVASFIYYDIERYQSWFQSHFDPNPIHSNPKYNGLKEFYVMNTDTKIKSNMNQRLDTLVNKIVYIPPALENVELEVIKAGFAKAALSRISNLPDKEKGILSDMIYGYSVSEKELGYANLEFKIQIRESAKKATSRTIKIPNAIIIKNIRNITPTAFYFDAKRHMYYTSEYGVDGVKISSKAQRKFIRSTYDSMFDSPYGWPLYTNIFPHWIMKKAILAWRLVFLEKFGIPTVKGTVPQNADPNSAVYRTFMAGLDNLMHAARIAVPKDYDVGFIEMGNRSGTMDMFQNALNYIDQCISELILGHKQATEATSVGSLASSTVKEAALRQAILESDAMRLDTVMAEQVVKFLIDLNFPSNGYYPDYRRYIEGDTSIKERRETFQFALDAGLTLSDTQIRRELHLDYPLGEFDEVKPEDSQRILRYIGKNAGGDSAGKGSNTGEQETSDSKMAS